MASLNKVILLGNLTRDPELRYTPGGTAVADVRLAVNRTYVTNGERRQETCYVGVVVWGKTAENVREYLKKGSQALIEGRLQTREWTGRDGQKRSILEVVAESVQFLGGAKNGGRTARREEEAEGQPAEAPAEDSYDDDVPF